MKNKLSILALISAATFSCGSAFANVTVYNELGEQQKTASNLNSVINDINNANGDTFSLDSDNTVSSALKITGATPSLIIESNDGATSRTISGGDANQIIKFSGTSLTLICENIIWADGYNPYATELKGGAIESSGALFLGGNATFKNNVLSGKEPNSGGAIWTSEITFLKDSKYTFSGNNVYASFETVKGGAIVGNVTVESGAELNFLENRAYLGTSSANSYGGAVCGNISIASTGKASFSGNVSYSMYDCSYGGAVYGNVVLASEAEIEFTNNRSYGGTFNYGSYGGAVKGNVTLGTSSKGTFSQNSVTANNGSTTGGGVARGGAVQGNVLIGSKSDVVFSKNHVSSYSKYEGGSESRGGAIYGSVTAKSGSKVSFLDNYVSASSDSTSSVMTQSAWGGAIYGTLTTEAGSSIVFSGNRTSLSCVSKSSKISNAGGAVYSYDTVRLSGMAEFIQNKVEKYVSSAWTADGDGGAIYSPTTIVSASANVSFKQNSAGRGGAIYSPNATTLESGSKALFSENYAKDSGGAIYTSAGSLSLAGEVQFSGNTAGAKGGAVYSTGELSFSGVADFSKNIAQNTSLGGGAIYHDGANATDGTIYIKSGSDLSFDQNRVETGSGGAIYTTKAILVSGNTRTNFSGNYAKINGGAIHTSHTFNVEGGTHEFVNNTAEGSGGAFSTISGISLKAGSSFTFSGNKAQKMGGAIYSNGSSYDAFELAGDTKFENNYAKGQGGAIYAAQALTISGGTHTFSGNDSVARGGAITATSSITVHSGATVTFDDNYAYVFGGALYLTGKAGINLDQGSVASFSNNTAYSGGAFYLWGDVNLSGKSEFKNNKAEYYTRTENITGGAIHTSGKVSFGEAAEANFDGNSIVATEQIDARGGAIYAASAELRGKLAFENNSIVATGASTNLSGVGGGAIYSEDAVTVATTATVKFAGNSVSNATKAFGGGAIWAKSLSLAGTLEFVGNSAVNPNSATGLAHGGAILSSERISFAAATNATFSQNTAAFGGAVRVIDGGLSFSGNGGKLAFSENVAGAHGGAIYAGNSGLTPKISLGGDVMFSANKAGKAGGAIYLGGDSTLEFSGDATKVVFSENKIGNDADGWTGNDIAAFGKKNSITIADAGTYKFGGGIDASVGNAVSIADANVTFGGESVNKFAGALTVANSASVTLEKGAALDLLSGGQLAVTSNAELVVCTNLAGATVINVAQGASVSFDNTAKLVIDLSTASSPLARSVAPTSGEAAQIAIICANSDSSIGDINNVELRVDGSAFTGDWSLSRENNTLYLVASIPEPSAFGLLAGLGALLLVGTRRRRKTA